MAKKEKMKTPDWILEGYDSPAEYNKAMQKNKFSTSSKQSSDSSMKGIIGTQGSTSEDFNKKSLQGAKKGKTFKIRECPKCNSDEVGIVLSNSDSEEAGNTGKQWECRKCKWTGKDIVEKELNEDELMEYMDKKGEEVA